MKLRPTKLPFAPEKTKPGVLGKFLGFLFIKRYVTVACANHSLNVSYESLLSHWKRRFATVLQKENALFILNSSSHVLFATNRFEPNCEPNLGEVLNLESIHCS